jgi:hypothetical protein
MSDLCPSGQREVQAAKVSRGSQPCSALEIEGRRTKGGEREQEEEKKIEPENV